MNIQIIFKRFALLTAALSVGTICLSQKQTIVGLSLTGENTSSSNFVVGIGGTFERQFTKSSAFETGLYYRNFKVYQQVLVNYSVYGFRNIKEEYVSIPVLYKFKSSILNFSIGPTFDFYLGWKTTGESSNIGKEGYDANTKFYVGLLGKVSKTISLTDRILFEPEFRYNPIFSNQRSFYGGAISFKYTLTK